MVPGFKPAWTEIAQYINGDLSPDFQVSDRSPHGISTVAEILSRPRASPPVKGASTSFQAPLRGPDRGVAWPLVRVRPWPTLPLGEGDVSLGGGPKPHLACVPKRCRTPLPLRALRVCSRPLSRLIPGEIALSEERGFLPQLWPSSWPTRPRRGAPLPMEQQHQGAVLRSRTRRCVTPARLPISCRCCPAWRHGSPQRLLRRKSLDTGTWT